MSYQDISNIKGWHAHVYFDASSIGGARALCEDISRRFAGVEMGRVHEKLVGPHTEWSCQLAFRPELFNAVMGFLALNRGDLTVFIHPITGQDLIDHRDRCIWMGIARPLKLEALPDFGVVYDLLTPAAAR